MYACFCVLQREGCTFPAEMERQARFPRLSLDVSILLSSQLAIHGNQPLLERPLAIICLSFTRACLAAAMHLPAHSLASSTPPTAEPQLLLRPAEGRGRCAREGLGRLLLLVSCNRAELYLLQHHHIISHDSIIVLLRLTTRSFVRSSVFFH